MVDLPSGAQAKVYYSATFGDIVSSLLLGVLIALTVVQMWQRRPS